ncbi:prevent-host-death family protein [Streptomyces violaceusniger]|nr:prevent-host-death family protein [Streptomyces violaceusniger]
MKNLVDEMSLTDIKNAFGDVVSKALLGQPTVGLNRGKRAIAVVPVEVLDKYLVDEQRELREMIREREDEETVPLAPELDEVTGKLSATATAADA